MYAHTPLRPRLIRMSRFTHASVVRFVIDIPGDLTEAQETYHGAAGRAFTAALRVRDGDGAVRPLDHDPATGTMLLERLDESRMRSAVADTREVVAEPGDRLPHRAPHWDVEDGRPVEERQLEIARRQVTDSGSGASAGAPCFGALAVTIRPAVRPARSITPAAHQMAMV